MAARRPSAHARHSDCRVPTDRGQHQRGWRRHVPVPLLPIGSPDRRRPPRPSSCVFVLKRAQVLSRFKILKLTANHPRTDAQRRFAHVHSLFLLMPAASRGAGHIGGAASACWSPRYESLRTEALGTAAWDGQNTAESCTHDGAGAARCPCHRGTGTRDRFAHTVICIHSFF